MIAIISIIYYLYLTTILSTNSAPIYFPWFDNNAYIYEYVISKNDPIPWAWAYMALELKIILTSQEKSYKNFFSEISEKCF